MHQHHCSDDFCLLGDVDVDANSNEVRDYKFVNKEQLKKLIGNVYKTGIISLYLLIF